MLPRIAALVVIGLAITLPGGLSAADAARVYPETKVDGGELRYVGDIPVAILSGDPAAMGRQHAELLAGSAQEALEFPKLAAAEFGLEPFWPFMAQAGRSLMMNAPARHQQELAAMVDRSQLGDERIVVANTLLELRRIGCSSLVVEPERSATGGPLLGRNFDFDTFGILHKYSLVFICRPEGKRPFAAVGFPGLVGVLSGMNDAGLAVVTLDVERSADRSRKFDPTGTPLAFVFRRLLEECGTIDEAEQLLRSEEPTTWMNLAVCDRDGGAVFEITPDHIARREDEQHLVYCTNHFRAEGMTVGESCWRYDALQQWPDEAPIDVAAVQARLHAANQRRTTLQTMVFEPRALAIHLAIGEPPSSDDPLTRIELAPLFAPQGAAVQK